MGFSRKQTTGPGKGSNLVLVEDGIADTGHEHHRDQERNHCFGRHGFSRGTTVPWKEYAESKGLSRGGERKLAG
ncbi:unnamed protein product [Aspergillus oryzae]|uniref:Unnamed protein product n=2 Tax=Aspergillus oryzae TaxID=5062 RepID=A0AAN4YWE8_ASPOZ|nr:unnamed protein product [Aspergillus oryzae]GMF91354.1 unnamed protein product [Aspergillus oryzae]GMG16327.1 unnamed protein product [Aspergillus oryzae]GMG35616.1 unnamed protein product [Aspergillus oryzae]GMG50670.1 unnamed protein product [Aspergillus oryzae var. brunneus]